MTLTPTIHTADDVPALGRVALDLYRDIHKGIRAELFGVVLDAGSTDPADRVARTNLGAHVGTVIDLLESHAEHEDSVIQPSLAGQLPDLASRIADDHEALDARTRRLREQATALVDAGAADRRADLHVLYLDLAAFTGDYLAHQDLEERLVMPALEAAVGLEAVVAMHEAIVSSIPPEEMAASLAVMLPAMNLDDRVEMLGGMQAGAPAEVFAGVWGLAGSVLPPEDHAALAARLGLTA